MKLFGNFYNDVEVVLFSYFYYCVLCMSCVDLVWVFCFFVDKGFCKYSGEQVFNEWQIKQVNVIMVISGFYDEVGNFVYWVGLLGKSGVGGGIIVVVLGCFMVCVWLLELNVVGNLLVGIVVLEKFSEWIGWLIF